MIYSTNADPRLLNVLKEISDTLKSMDKKLEEISDYYANPVEVENDGIIVETTDNESED